MDGSLAERLRAVGVEADAISDPEGAWQRLHDAYGTRATLLDRYALDRDDRIAYNEAKTDFILDTMERAQAWRTRTMGADQ